MIPQDILDLIRVILGPGVFFLMGKYFLGKQSALESRIQAMEQVLNGYNEQAGLIEDVNWLKKIKDRRTH